MRLLGDRTMNNEIDDLLLNADDFYSDMEVDSAYPNSYNYLSNEINTVNIAVLKFKTRLLAYLVDKTNHNQELMIEASMSVASNCRLRNQFFDVMSDTYVTKKDFNYLKFRHCISWNHTPEHEVNDDNAALITNYHSLLYQSMQISNDAHRLHGQGKYSESCTVEWVANALDSSATEYAKSIKQGVLNITCLQDARDDIRNELKTAQLDVDKSVMAKITAVIEFISSLLPVSLNNMLLHRFTSISKLHTYNSIHSVINSAAMSDESHKCSKLPRIRL